MADELISSSNLYDVYITNVRSIYTFTFSKFDNQDHHQQR